MASEELIALVAEAIVDNPPIETMTDDEIIIDWSPTAKAAISTILAALQETTGGMYQAGIEYHDIEKTPSVYHGIFRAMLNASPLGEQSE